MVPVTEEVEPEPEIEEVEIEPEIEDDGIDQLKAEIAEARKSKKAKKSKSLEDGSISMGDKYVATMLNGKVEIKQIGWVGPSELVVHKDDFAGFLEVLQSL